MYQAERLISYDTSCGEEVAMPGNVCEQRRIRRGAALRFHPRGFPLFTQPNQTSLSLCDSARTLHWRLVEQPRFALMLATLVWALGPFQQLTLDLKNSIQSSE